MNQESERKKAILIKVQVEHYYFYMQKSKKKKKRKDLQEEESIEDYDLGEEPMKPIPPKMVDSLEIEQQVREKANNFRRKPGEPALIPELVLSGSVTPSEQCPR